MSPNDQSMVALRVEAAWAGDAGMSQIAPTSAITKAILRLARVSSYSAWRPGARRLLWMTKRTI